MIFCILPASAFLFTLVSSNGGKASTTGNHTGSHAFLIAPERRRLRTLKIKKQIANVTCYEYPLSIRYMVKHWSKCLLKKWWVMLQLCWISWKHFIDKNSSTGCNLLNGKGSGLKLTFSVACQVVTMDRKTFCLQLNLLDINIFFKESYCNHVYYLYFYITVGHFMSLTFLFMSVCSCSVDIAR